MTAWDGVYQMEKSDQVEIEIKKAGTETDKPNVYVTPSFIDEIKQRNRFEMEKYKKNRKDERNRQIVRYYLKDVYLGPEYSDAEIKAALDQAGLKYQCYEKIEPRIAKLLAAGKIIGRFNGRMEYGPRALGNRTILVQATDHGVNDALNKKLKRTEFMPFAPAVLMEAAEQCFIGVERARHAASFMTITFACTDFMKQTMPAAVHVDGTARPQLVEKAINPSLHAVISAYEKLTGIPGVINTSFNMHEEPIVCSPDDAIRSFLDGALDHLAIGNYLVALSE